MLHERCVHIVDDEAKVRDALTLLLSTAQIESRSYGSAEEYLTSNPLKEPACILLDNQLPGMSGIELLKRIVAASTEFDGHHDNGVWRRADGRPGDEGGRLSFCPKAVRRRGAAGHCRGSLVARRRRWRRSPRNEGVQGPAGVAHAARAGGAHPSAWRGCRPSSSRTSCASARGRPNITGPPLSRRCKRATSRISCEWRSLREISTAASGRRNNVASLSPAICSRLRRNLCVGVPSEKLCRIARRRGIVGTEAMG